MLETPIVAPNEQILTIALFGGTSNLKFLQIVDDINVRVTPDETKIRFYNLDSIPITFTVNPVIDTQSRSLTSGEGTEYYNVSPGNYNIQISWPSELPGYRPKSVNITLNPGRIYTLYFINSINPDSPSYSVANIPQVVLVVDGNTLYEKCSLYYK